MRIATTFWVKDGTSAGFTVEYQACMPVPSNNH